jgi:hypothetical protein
MMPIPGFHALHATSEGAIVSTRSGQPRKLKVRLDEDGYPTVTVWCGETRGGKPVHRLVALAFHGEPDQGQQCRHLDGNKLNSVPTNLAWGTAGENAQDSLRHGALGKGMLARRRKLTPASAVEIVTRAERGESAESIAADHGIHPTYVGQLLKGRFWAEATGRGGKSLQP